MRILVIGGTQFMGREIVRRLMARGHEVTVLHRRDRTISVPRFAICRQTAAISPGFRRSFHRDGSMRCSTRVRLAERHPADQVEAAARSCGDQLQRYVFMSSLAAYEPGSIGAKAIRWRQRQSEPLRAAQGRRPNGCCSACTRRPAFRSRRSGPRLSMDRDSRSIANILLGSPARRPADYPARRRRRVMPWVYVDDVAEACVRAMEVPEAAGEAFNSVTSNCQRSAPSWNCWRGWRVSRPRSCRWRATRLRRPEDSSPGPTTCTSANTLICRRTA